MGDSAGVALLPFGRWEPLSGKPRAVPTSLVTILAVRIAGAWFPALRSPAQRLLLPEAARKQRLPRVLPGWPERGGGERPLETRKKGAPAFRVCLGKTTSGRGLGEVTRAGDGEACLGDTTVDGCGGLKQREIPFPGVGGVGLAWHLVTRVENLGETIV